MAATSSPGQISWSQSPSTLTLTTNRVDIWKVSLDESPAEDSTAEVTAGVLSTDEVARAHRFHFERDRLHFTRCRSALRNLLARYLVIPADKIHFEFMASGKTYIAADQNPERLQFNVSHSGGIALIAIGSERRLGVDIEKIRGDVDTGSLAERFLSVRERAGLQALPEHLRVAGFYACWARKEAFLKATGQGLSFPLSDFSVTTHPDRVPELEEIRGNGGSGKRWFLSDVSVADAYRATVASDGSYFELRTYAWN